MSNDLDVNLTVSSALISQLLSGEIVGEWEVSQSYEIKDSFLRAQGNKIRKYKPQDHPELPLLIAELADGDDNGIIEFAGEWGLLGYQELLKTQSSKVVTPGDPLDWIVAHAKRLAFCLRAVEQLQEDDSWQLEELWLKQRFGDPVPPVLWENFLRFTMPRVLLHKHINDNIKRLEPTLVVGYNDDGMPFDKLAFGFTAMIEIAYLHVMQLHLEKGSLGRCEECGKLVLQKPRKRRFCPAPPNYTNSICAQKARNRKYYDKLKREKAKHKGL